MPQPPSDQATARASRDLAVAFDEEFQVVVADTPELRDASFALRHEVYRREFGFEAVHADGSERNAYDERARHYLLRHKPTGAWAGSVRVVFAEDTDGEIGLPFEAAGVRLLDPPPIDLTTLPRASIGEIPRLAVAAPFRRDRHEPSTLLGAALIAVAATAHSGLGSAVCMMKPRLEQQFTTYGIRFTRLSGIVHHRGDRALFHIVPHITCRDVRPELRGILTAIRSRLS